MSLYNMLHGRNPLSHVLLAVLGIDQEDGKWNSGRFRDIYLNEDGTRITLYTRNGGGNREHFDDDTEAGESCKSYCCCLKHPHLPTHPNYVSDWDDDFDSTYAYVEFTVPQEYAEFCKSLADGKKPETVHQKFERTMQELNGLTIEQIRSDKRFAPVCNVMDKIAAAIEGPEGAER